MRNKKKSSKEFAATAELLLKEFKIKLEEYRKLEEEIQKLLDAQKRN